MDQTVGKPNTIGTPNVIGKPNAFDRPIAYKSGYTHLLCGFVHNRNTMKGRLRISEVMVIS